MPLFFRIRTLVSNLLRRDRVEDELDAELKAYLGQLTEEKIAAGLSEEQASREARRELGGIDLVKARVREVRI